MKIEYAVAMDDLYALQEYYQQSSRTFRRSVLSSRIASLISIPIVTAAIGSSLLPGQFWLFLVVGLLSGIVCFATFPRIIRSNSRKQLEKLYSEGGKSGVLGRHELEITDEGLVERSEAGQSLTRWDHLPRIGETPAHLFVFITVLTAHVIPKGQVPAAALAAFKEELLRRSPGARTTPGG